MKVKLSDAVVELEKMISKRRGTLNEQDIDYDISGYISIYKFGSKPYRDRAKIFLRELLVNSGWISKRRDIIMNDWSDEE